MVICLRGLLSIIHFLSVHADFFYFVDKSVSLMVCVTVSYRVFHIILRIILQNVHVECCEYVLEFYAESKLAGVPQRFSIVHGPDSLSLPKSYIATTGREYCSYGFSCSPFFSQQCAPESYCL